MLQPDMRTIITNGIILNDQTLQSGRSLVIQDGTVTGITPGLEQQAGDSVIDAGGGYVLPGLVDIHTHGTRDVMVDKDDIFRFSEFQLAGGVTACVPTLAGSPDANARRMREVLRQTNDFSLTPNLVGFRPEIMYVADASGGPAASLARPEPARTQAVWDASGG
jgi:dihydroorotase-like cyclic amidohydrolase